MKTILIIGATSTMAQACVKYWCKILENLEFIFIARDEQKLNDFDADLKIRYPYIKTHKIVLDLSRLDLLYDVFKYQFDRVNIDIALIAHGMMYVDESDLSVDDINRLIHVNCSSMAVSLDIVYHFMSIQNYGKIGVISSIAGERGRKSNYLYGSSKAFVSTYVEGLQHKVALQNQKIHICLIKPGPTSTAMTKHITQQGKKMAEVDDVAQLIVNGIEQNKKFVYAPSIWRYIMFVIRNIPFFFFKKMDI